MASNYRKAFDAIAGMQAHDGDRQTQAEIVFRTAISVAQNEDHPHYATMAKYIMDQTVGRPTETVDVNLGVQRGMVFSEVGASLFGVSSVQARTVNEKGEVEDVDINLGGEVGSDD